MCLCYLCLACKNALVLITSQVLGVQVLFFLVQSWYIVFGFICKFNHCLIKAVRKYCDGAGSEGKDTDLWELLLRFLNLCKWTVKTVLCDNHYCLSTQQICYLYLFNLSIFHMATHHMGQRFAFLGKHFYGNRWNEKPTHLNGMQH